jgi:hypothetical protein
MSAQPCPPRIGILAGTVGLAQSLARELGISKPILLSARSIHKGGGRCDLSTVLIDESALPLEAQTIASLTHCLTARLGYMLFVKRIDPRKKR